MTNELFKMDLCSSGNTGFMATAGSLRPVTANTRDGVDTRKKEVTTRSGGDRGQDGSDAASEFDAWLATLPHVRLDLAVPAGAEVEGAPMWGAWGAYEQIAVRRIEDSDESFRWVSYETQRERAEEALVAGVSEEDQMDMVLLNNLNREVVALAYAIVRARHQLRASPFLLDYHKTVVLSRVGDVEDAEAEIAIRHMSAPTHLCQECGWTFTKDIGVCWPCMEKQEEEGWDREVPGDCACGEPVYIEGRCADCYWEEDARIKFYRRRGMAVPPPPIRIPEANLDEPEVWTPRVY